MNSKTVSKTAAPGPVGPATTDVVARFRGVGFTYPDGTHALDDLTFDIDGGRILGICGPSGCGKSSLLALLAKIRKPTAGEIIWSADPQAENRGRTRHPTSMVFQKDTLLPWLTVNGNARLFTRLNRGKYPEAGPLVDELLDIVGLDSYRDYYPYQLSGGMRRRLAFIAAMAASPRVLLLDEPFSSLDEPTRVSVHQDVHKIVKKLGTTVVLVTHDLAEAVSLCDEVVILTRRPGSVATRHEVPFGETRNVLEIRERPEFLELYGKFWNDLRRQIAGPEGDER